MEHAAFPQGVSQQTLVEWYRAIRSRTAAVFTIPREESYYERPIALRNPIVFYEGHLPAFAVNTLVKRALGLPGIDEHYETLFARGIDPESADAVRDPADVWPTRSDVQAYGRAAQGLIERALGIEDDSVFTILEHELMHQETLLYMFHNLPYGEKVAREPFHRRLEAGGLAGWKPAILDIPRGRATLGADGTEFGWDNEFPALVVDVDEFAIDALNVTNADYLEFMEATGASHPYFWERSVDAWMWRGMFAPISLPLDWPVYVTHAEASAYAAWKGCRLPTEAEYHRAAFGTPSGEERLHPWGDEPPDHTRGNFDFQSWDPLPVGSFPRGASAWGVHDLTGNGWEWTSSVFAGFPGFTPMPSYPEYSADFFDGDHYVLKGASPSTPLELVRRSFRNWFRPSYPYVYAKFRCVR